MPAIAQALLASYGGGAGGGGTPGVATSMIFIDGAQHITNANDKWPNGSDPAIATSETGAFGRCYDNATLRQAKDLGANFAALSVRVRFKVRSLASDDNLIRLQDTSATNQVAFRILSTGAFQVGRGNTPVLLGSPSASGLITTDTWYWAELAAVIDNAGSYTARLFDDSGTLLDTISGTGVDTQSTANAFANRLDVGSTVLDSFTQEITLDGTDSLLGPLRLATFYMTANGATNQWSRGGADSGANWSQLDEAQNNDTTDDVRSATNGEVDLYVPDTIAVSGAIHALQVTPVARRSASVGGMTFRPLARVGGVNHAGATKTLTDAYIAHPHCWGASPDTSVGWTATELQQAGIERVAGTESTVRVECTQIVVEVAYAL